MAKRFADKWTAKVGKSGTEVTFYFPPGTLKKRIIAYLDDQYYGRGWNKKSLTRHGPVKVNPDRIINI